MPLFIVHRHAPIPRLFVAGPDAFARDCDGARSPRPTRTAPAQTRRSALWAFPLATSSRSGHLCQFQHLSGCRFRARQAFGSVVGGFDLPRLRSMHTQNKMDWPVMRGPSVIHQANLKDCYWLQSGEWDHHGSWSEDHGTGSTFRLDRSGAAWRLHCATRRRA